MPETNDKFKSGFIAFVGRPNAGKSTLLNAILGKKVAITSDVAQTTRHRIRAILNKKDMQLVFVDTPGLHKPHDVLGQELNEGAFQATSDCDVVCVLIDGSQDIGRGDKWVVEKIAKLKCPKICIISKVDLIDDDQKLKQVEAASELLKWDALVCLSSKSKYNVDALLEEISMFIPYGPIWFPGDVNTDQPLEVMIAEFIREKILHNMYEEVPHSIGVDIEDMEYIEKKNLYKIYANAYVEKKSQKGIVIGAGGKTIKTISTTARQDLEKLLDAKVFLDLEVKIKKD